jgi:hypothetical protein
MGQLRAGAYLSLSFCSYRAGQALVLMELKMLPQRHMPYLLPPEGHLTSAMASHDGE